MIIRIPEERMTSILMTAPAVAMALFPIVISDTKPNPGNYIQKL